MPCFKSISSMYSAMAGDAESPGDSIPAAFIKPSSGEFIIKSPVLPAARSPQKEVIVLLNAMPLTSSAASRIICAKPSLVVLLSSLLSIFCEVGPVSRFPSTVGDTSMPFPAFVGVLNIVCETSPPHSLSRRIYSPLLGVTVKELSPTIAATESE